MNDLLKIIVDAELKKDSNLEQSLQSIKNAFKNISVKVDIDSEELNKLTKNMEAIQGKSKKMKGELGKNIAGGINEGTEEVENLGKALDKVLKKANKVTNKGKTSKTTTGDGKFKQTTVTEDKNGVKSIETIENHKELNKIYDQMNSKISKMGGLTTEQRQEMKASLDAFKKGQKIIKDSDGKNVFQDLVFGSKEFLKQNEKLIRDYERLEDREIAYQSAIKKRSSINKKLEGLKSDKNNSLNPKDYKDLNDAVNGGGKNKSGLIDLKTLQGVEQRYEKIVSLYDQLVLKNKEKNDWAKKEKDELERKIQLAQQEAKIANKINDERGKEVVKKQEKDVKDGEDIGNKREQSQSKNLADEQKDAKKQADAVNSELERQYNNQKKITEEAHFFNERLQEVRQSGMIKEADINRVEEGFKNISKFSETLGFDLKIAKNELKAIEKQASDLQRTSYSNGNSRKQKEMDTDISKNVHKDNASSMLSRKNIPIELIEEFRGEIDKINFKSTKADLADVKRQWTTLVELERELLKAKGDTEKQDKLKQRAMENMVNKTQQLSDSLERVEYTAKSAFDRRNINPEQYEEVQREIGGVVERLERVRMTQQEMSNEEKRHVNEQITRIQRQVEEYKRLENQMRDAYAQNERVDRRRQGLGNDVQSNFDWDVIQDNDIRGNQQRIRDEIHRTTQALHEHEDQYSRIDREMIRVRPTIDAVGNEIYRVEYQVDRGNRQFEDFTLTLDRNGRAVRDLGQNMRMLRRDVTTMEQLGQAMEKVPIWAMATGMVYGAMNQFTEGFQMMLDLDKEMTNLKKVANESRQELMAFEDTAIGMGKSLGMTASEVVQATTEFARLGYSLEQASALGKQSLIYANVGDMDVEAANTNIVSAVKGFGVEVDAEGKNVKKIVDIYNEVSNNFAISAEGIGEALKRSSALLSQAGNSMEQSVALITAANTTIQDPKKVGTAMKTIAMRLRGVSEEGKEIIGLVPDMQKQFERLNIDMMIDDDTFKNTYDLMDELSEKWVDMTDVQKAQITEMIGGKRQGSIVASMIDNWTDATASYETALNSAGSAQEEFTRYQDSFQYKIGQLKSSAEELWNAFYDDQAVKGAIDGLRGLIELLTQLTKTLGMLPVLASALVMIGALANKHLRGFVMRGEGLTRVRTAITGIGTASGGATAMVKGLSMAMLRLASVVLPILLLTVGIEAIVGALMKAKNAREEHLMGMRDEYEQTEQLLSSYEELDMERYNSLSSMDKSKLGTDERSELNRLQSELVGIMPEVIDYYDKEGEAVFKSKEAIEALIEAKQKEQDVKKAELAKEEIAQFDYGKNLFADDGIANIVNDMQSLEKTFEQMHGGGFASRGIIKSFFENEFQALEDGTPEMEQALKGLMDNLKSSLTEDEFNNFSTNGGRGLINSMTVGSRNKEDMARSFDDFLTMTTNAKTNFDLEMDALKESLAVETTELDTHMMALAESFALDNDIEIDSNQFKMIQTIADNYALGLAGMESDSDEFVKYLSSFGDEIEEIFKDMDDMGIDADSLQVGDTDSEIKALESLSDKYDDNSGKALVLEGIIANLEKQRDAEKVSNEEVAESYGLTEEAINQLNETYANATNDIAFLNGAKEQLADTGQFEADTMMELVNRFPQLIQYLGDEAEMERQLSNAIIEKGEIATDVMQQRLMNDEQFFNTSLKANSDFFNELGDMYNIDISNWKSLAQAKAETESALIRQLGGAWAEYYKVQADGSIGLSSEFDKLAGENGGAVSMKMRAIMSQQNKMSAEAKRIADRFSSLTSKAINVDFGSIGVSAPKKASAGKKPKKKSGSSKADEPDYQDTTDAWLRQKQLGAERLKQQEDEIENKIKLAEGEENYALAMKHSYDLMKNYKARMAELQNANRQISNRMSGYNRSWVDDDGQETLAYLNAYNSASKSQQESMKESFSSLSALQKQYTSNKDSIQELGFSIKDLGNEIEGLETERLEKKLSDLNDRINEVYDSFTRRKGDLEREFSFLEEGDRAGNVALIKKRMDLMIKERKIMIDNISQLKKLRKELAGQPELLKENAEEIASWEDQLKDLGTDIVASQNEVKSVYNEIADEVIEHYKDAIEEQMNEELEAIDKTMDAEKERHEMRMEYLDKEMEKFEEAIQQQMDAIDKKKEQEDYEEQLAEKQEGRQETINEINKYAMDNTAEGRRRLSELQEELSEKEKELQEFMENQQIKTRKDALNDQLEDKRDEIEAEKELEDKQHQELIDKLTKEREYWNKYYTDILEDERKWSKIRKDILNENFDSIQKEMEGYIVNLSEHMREMKNKFSGYTEEIAGNIQKNMIEKLKETILLMNDLKHDQLTSSDLVKGKANDMSKNSSSGSSSSSKSSGSSKSSSSSKSSGGSSDSSGGVKNSLRKRSGGFDAPNGGWNMNSISDYLKSKGYYADWKDRNKLYKQFNGNGSYKGTVAQNAWLLGKTKTVGLRTGGYTGDWSGDGGRVAMLHKKELVLNKFDTENILKAVKSMRNLKDFMPKLKPTPISAPLLDEGRGRDSQSGDVNINFHIENLNGGEEGARTMVSKINNALDRRGVRR